MTNRHTLEISILASAVLALCLPAVAAAQWGGSPENRYPDDYRNDNGRSGRYDGRYLRDTIRELDRLSSDFTRDLDRRLDHSRVDGTRSEDHINADAKEFRRAVQRLKDRFDNGRNLDRTENEARTVLEAAGHVQRESRSFLNDARLSSEWSAIRRNLRTIADEYDLSWADFDDGYDRRDNPDPRGRNDDYRRNGGYGRNRNNDWWRRLPFPR
jgi:hypothetical protein